jgi:hypothetical protein
MQASRLKHLGSKTLCNVLVMFIHSFEECYTLQIVRLRLANVVLKDECKPTTQQWTKNANADRTGDC